MIDRICLALMLATFDLLAGRVAGWILIFLGLAIMAAGFLKA